MDLKEMNVEVFDSFNKPFAGTKYKVVIDEINRI